MGKCHATSRVVLTLLLVLSGPSRSAAQGAAQHRVGLTNQATWTLSDSRQVRGASSSGSYWLTGGIIGSAVGVVAVLATAAYGDGKIRPRFVAFAIGIGPLIGGVPGALIGSLFKKKDGSEDAILP